MNLKIRILATFALVALTISLFPLLQSASAVNGYQKTQGNITIVNSFNRTTNKTILQVEKFDFTTQTVFTSFFTPKSNLTLFALPEEDLKDVILGTWNWACCKKGVYNGTIEIHTLKNSEVWGNFGGAGGGSVVGDIKGQTLKFRRTSDACSSNGKYQDWTGTYNPSNRTISGTIAGCNVDTDENIRDYPRFTMTKP